MTIQTKPNMNYGLWADNGNIEIPSSEKVTEGWVIEKPLNEQMNWLQNRSDRMLQYLNQRGIPEWDLRTEYPADAFVSRVGRIYKSLSQNLDSDPTLNPEIWEVAFVSYNEFATYADRVDNIINTDGYLYNYVRKSAPVMLAAAKGVAYNNPAGVSGMKFSGVVPEIVTNGYTVAEFGGGTNPKDVVTHEQLALAIQNYKIGDIYITTAGGDPSERLGYGTWERFAEGKTLVGFTTSVSNSLPEWVKVIGSEFGSYTHKLAPNELPDHEHDLKVQPTSLASDDTYESTDPVSLSASAKGGFISGGGGDQPHNNVQPSIVVYFWKRVS